MRFLVVMVSAGAALALIAASGLMNWVFMTSLGKSEFEQHILGAVSVAVSAFLALLPTLLLWAWRERRVIYFALGIPVFLAFAAFSLSSAVGFAAKNRGSISEDRRFAAASLTRVKQEIADAEAKRAAFGNLKPLSVLQQSLRGLEQDKRWQSSKSCDEATTDASRTFCKTYFDLKAEMAFAEEAAVLEARIGNLKIRARQLEEQGAGREADSQAAVLARILGLETQKIERSLTLFLAMLVEMGAALGLYFATGHMRLERTGRGAKVIDAEVSSEARRPRQPMKQIPDPTPRRVPRLARGQ
jgi:hypothetical protein